MKISEMLVGDRVRLSKDGDVYEFTVRRVGDGTYPYIQNGSGVRLYDNSGWKIELLDHPASEGPEGGLGTLVSVYDTAMDRSTILVKVRIGAEEECRWVDVQGPNTSIFKWSFWMRDVRSGSVKVLYTAAE